MKPSPGGEGRGRPKKIGAVSEPISERNKAAEKAGLSKRQQHTALRLARIPKEEFESLIESDKPPTITELAERGTEKKPKPVVDLQGRDPKDFNNSTQAVGRLWELVESAAKWDFESIARGAFKNEHAETLELIQKIRGILERLETAIAKEMKA